MTWRDASEPMVSVRILDQTYTLPTAATEAFRRLQEQIQLRQRLIQEGVRPQSRRWGLLPRVPTPLSVAERLHELHLLIRDYDTIIAELQVSKEAYEAFLTQLAAGVQRAVQRKGDEIRQIEQERAALQASAVAQQDAALAQWTRQSAEQLVQSVRLLGQAALLLLKKVALCHAGITRLAEDQAVQRRVLDQLVSQFENHRRAYELQQRIEQVTRDVADMAAVALHFEAYMRDHFGPLQTLLAQVSRVDTTLHSAVAEIEALTQQMLQQEGVPWHSVDALDQRLLDFLTTSHLKRERLTEVVERLYRQDGTEEHFEVALAMGPTVSVPEALDNIDLLVEARLCALRNVPALPHVDAAAEPRQEHHSLSLARTSPVARPGESPHVDPCLNSLDMEFVLIPAGTYSMGAHGARQGRQVTISQPFYLGKYVVTQAQWMAIMGTNPSRFPGEDHPVESVSWDDVQEFIRTLNAREWGGKYRLPTEAEWEYAARAGATTAYCFGSDARHLDAYAWYAANARGTTHPVGQRQPNAWGLHDMHGNVWEWVQDWYGTYPAAPARDPQGPAAGSHRLRRGGGWHSDAHECSVAYRSTIKAGDCYSTLGFRLLRTASEEAR
jgi:formylglycine-generating enzyme required for sulfatase activity